MDANGIQSIPQTLQNRTRPTAKARLVAPRVAGPHHQPSAPRDPPQLPVYSPVMDNLPVHTMKAWTALAGSEVDHTGADALRLPQAV